MDGVIAIVTMDGGGRWVMIPHRIRPFHGASASAPVCWCRIPPHVSYGTSLNGPVVCWRRHRCPLQAPSESECKAARL